MSAALIAFLVSVAAGGFGSMVGIGGGLVIVPLLSVVLGYDVKVAIAASLVGVIATSLSASPRYIRTGIADRRLGLFLLVAAALGGLAGGVTAGLLDGRTLSLLFALLLTGVALRMLWQIRHPSRPPAFGHEDDAAGFISGYIEPSTGEAVRYRAHRLGPGALVSFLAGNVSGLLGVGGGVINVPTMNVLMHVPIRVATTTSTYMLAATAAASAFVYLASGRLDPLLAAPVALGVIVGARSGARLSLHLSQDALRLAFVAVAAVFAVGMLVEFLQL
ncbi:MAG: sulfite exporter TauE/SafE family protein [Chloroflexota bacterium]